MASSVIEFAISAMVALASAWVCGGSSLLTGRLLEHHFFGPSVLAVGLHRTQNGRAVRVRRRPWRGECRSWFRFRARVRSLHNLRVHSPALGQVVVGHGVAGHPGSLVAAISLARSTAHASSLVSHSAALIGGEIQNGSHTSITVSRRSANVPCSSWCMSRSSVYSATSARFAASACRTTDRSWSASRSRYVDHAVARVAHVSAPSRPRVESFLIATTRTCRSRLGLNLHPPIAAGDSHRRDTSDTGPSCRRLRVCPAVLERMVAPSRSSQA